MDAADQFDNPGRPDQVGTKTTTADRGRPGTVRAGARASSFAIDYDPGRYVRLQHRHTDTMEIRNSKASLGECTDSSSECEWRTSILWVGSGRVQ
jgi:hypothetical protein